MLETIEPLEVLAFPRTEGRFERLAWERHERDLLLAYPHGIRENAEGELDPRRTLHPRGLWFDEAAGAHVIDFIEGLCKHHKGEWAGAPLLLESWQSRSISIGFGWMRADGTRRFRIIYVEVPRKNGKSELAAALGLYLLVADQEPGAEVYSSATKKDQAKIVHDTAGEMVRQSPELRRFVRTYRNSLSCARLGSKFLPLGADSNTLDGLNPHGNIVDELHAHRDRGVWDVLDTAMGARRQPMTIAITTAGVYDPESIGWQQHDHCVKVLEGALVDDAFFGFIACAEKPVGAAVWWDDPEAWATANPNIGVSVKPGYLKDQCEKAKTQPSFTNTFLRLHLNVWTEQLDRWLSVEHWNLCEAELAPAAYVERTASLEGEQCYAGLDLSTKLDITALTLWFPKTHDVVCRFWCPAATVMERSAKDRVPYDAWVRDGWLLATPGNVIDYDFIKLEALALAKRFKVTQWAFDPWNATQLATQLGGTNGLKMVETRQGFKTLSEPAKELEKLIVAHDVRHGGHPVLRWMVSNVARREDANGNIAPDKSSSSGRIDGVVALVMALSRSIVEPITRSVYDLRGIRTL